MNAVGTAPDSSGFGKSLQKQYRGSGFETLSCPPRVMGMRFKSQALPDIELGIMSSTLIYRKGKKVVWCHFQDAVSQVVPAVKETIFLATARNHQIYLTGNP